MPEHGLSCGLWFVWESQTMTKYKAISHWFQCVCVWRGEWLVVVVVEEHRYKAFSWKLFSTSLGPSQSIH